MELLVLGACGSWPAPGKATSGYLLTHDGFNLWIDLGTGTLARLQEHITLTSVNAVLISHAHPDHCVDLHMLFYARSFHPGALPPLPLFMPPGAFDRIASGVTDRTQAAMRKTFDLQEAEPGASFEIGPFQLETRAMRHTVPTLGVRVRAGDKVVAYTADTAATEEIEQIAHGSDLFVAEATYLQHDERALLHLSAREAGEFAARAAVGRLLLTHIWPSVDPEAAQALAAEAFSGPVTVAVEGLRL